MHHVHLIDPGAGRKFSGLVSRLRYLLVLLIRDHGRDRFGELAELVGNRVLQLREVDHAERHLLAGALFGSDLDERIDDLLSDLGRRHRSVLSQCREPVGIIPAYAGLRLFRRHHVVAVISQHQGCLRRRHQARVEADEVKLHAALFQCLTDPGERHGAAAFVFFIIAVSADGSAAVIPQDQFIAVRGEVLRTILDIARQIVRTCHGRRSRIFLKALDAAVHHLIDLVDLIADDTVAPVAAASRKYQQIDIASELGRSHLLQVGSTHSASGLQIRSAQVDHDRNGILAIPLDLRVFFSGSGRDIAVQVCMGGILTVPSRGEGTVAAVMAVCVIEVLISRTGGVILLRIPVVAGGRIVAAASPASKQAAQRTTAAQQQNDEDHDHRQSSHAAAVPVSAA